MNLQEMKREVEALGKSPVAEKVYPITSDWVPLPDVLAIIKRFEKDWKHYKETKKGATEAKLIAEILGEA